MRLDLFSSEGKNGSQHFQAPDDAQNNKERFMARSGAVEDDFAPGEKDQHSRIIEIKKKITEAMLELHTQEAGLKWAQEGFSNPGGREDQKLLNDKIHGIEQLIERFTMELHHSVEELNGERKERGVGTIEVNLPSKEEIEALSSQRAFSRRSDIE